MNNEWILYVTIGVYLFISFLLHLYGVNAYLMILLFLRSRKRRAAEEQEILTRFADSKDDGDLPVVTTQLPVYNERNVVERLLEAVCAFDYPTGKHEIQLLDDSTDETGEIGAELASRLRAEGHDVQYIHRKERVGYKAGALAEGLLRARGEYIAIFDADFVPPPDFLRRTVPFLIEDPGCGFVQTRWGHRNRDFSTLTQVQGIGIDGHFVVEQSARCWNDLFCNFNGTAGIWRRQAIEDAGGWNADTLTEDLDLSYRSQFAGWRPRYLLDVVTPAEIPTNINALKAQQYRWAKGSIQGAIKLLPTVWRRPDFRLFKKIQASLHLTQYMVHPLILLITFLILPLVFLLDVRFTSLYAAPLILGMFVALFGPTTMYVFAQAVSGGSWRRTILCFPALMAFGIGLAVNNTRAVLSAVFGDRGGEFVRTPKLGIAAEEGRPEMVPGAPAGRFKAYRQPLSRLYLAEIFMGLWALTCFVGSIHTIGSLAGPFLLVQALGFTYVGLISLMHERTIRKLKART